MIRHLLILIMLCVLAGCHPKPARPIPLGASVVLGTVTAIGSVWTCNGDGCITIRCDDNRQNLPVSIIGSPSRSNTQIELKTVRYIQDLKGHRVEIIGARLKHFMIAQVIREL